MNDRLVSYKSYLAPKNATYTSIHVMIPNALGFSGEVAIALTKEAFWIVAPSGEFTQVPFMNIADVRVDQFPGIVYRGAVDGYPTYIAPNDTAGVTVEFRNVARLPNRVSFLTHLPNQAYIWVHLITEAVNGFYRKKLEETITIQGGYEE